LKRRGVDSSVSDGLQRELQSDVGIGVVDAVESVAGPESPASVPGGPCAHGRHADGRFAKGHSLSRDTQFTVGNLAAASTLQHTDRLPPELSGLQREIETFVNGSLVDEGDSSDVSTRRWALLEYRARLHRRIIQLDAALELRGIVDRRQKLRAAWLSALASLIERARQLDVTLGLARRAKPVPTLAEYLNSLSAESETEHGDQAGGGDQDEQEPAGAAIGQPQDSSIDPTGDRSAEGDCASAMGISDDGHRR
jgi:hypothetical protein